MNLRSIRRPSAAGPRAWLRGTRRWLLALLVIAAIVLHDSVGVLLAIMAVLVLIDSVVPVPGDPGMKADDRFRLMVRKGNNARRMRRLRGQGPERLELFDDTAGWASIAPRRALGVEAIAIESIVGTVEHAKALDFDRRFRPGWSTSRRWQRVWLAQAQGIELPPISVYRVDGRHIVRDGHHRVSVARDRGLPAVDADVVELLRTRAAA